MKDQAGPSDSWVSGVKLGIVRLGRAAGKVRSSGARLRLFPFIVVSGRVAAAACDGPRTLAWFHCSRCGIEVCGGDFLEAFSLCVFVICGCRASPRLNAKNFSGCYAA
ncbi:hypothetical protein MTO96_039312 [Rhipicephalus appendiculatus]